ncbi:Aldo-keto reductase family 1 member B10 [Pseudolycoriella hygida]|uniref:Aldo-keto reductase family 1 member B10 n=1 Tax=Pseudolycoriella hygida TaxID=35572 RepID=A0A9Q0N9U4_9DIPT|nr:Aldo-keto reductase family 1 member B10 [Pseudolycoriella hygida]
MAPKVPNVLLNNGENMPIIGLGTWNSPPGEVTQAVCDAIDAGYRSIDCAHVYENEHEIGDALSAKIKEGVVTRKEMFITSKLWNTFHRPDLVRGALETTLKNLQISYLDLYLIHWPFALKEGGDLLPQDEQGNPLYSYADFVDTWKEMEKAVDDGLTKSIGISNFNKQQTQKILSHCRIPPAVQQIECHPYLTQRKLSEFCKSKGITVTAYSPLGSPKRPWVTADDVVLLEDPKIIALTTKYKKNAAQILIRYQIQRGHVVIPKSVTKSRIISNFDVFDFSLTDDDVAVLDSFDCNGRICPLTTYKSHPDWPFNDEY